MPDLRISRVNRTQSRLHVLVGRHSKINQKVKKEWWGMGVFLDRIVSEELMVKQKPKVCEGESRAKI